MRIPITAAIVLALLSGCAVPHAVRYEKPVPLVPNAWAEQEKMQHASDNVAELQTWWKAFNDPLLNRLVDRALANNLDLKIASQRLLAARAERDAISADRGPKLGIAASTLDQRSSPLVDWPRGIGVSNAQTVEFEASWEPDLFGRIKQSIEAADATAGSIEEDRRAILTSLLAEIASNYIELRSEQQRLAIAERNVARTKATYDTNVRLRSAGIVDASSLTQAHAEWQAAVAQLPIWHARVSKHSHAIAVLVGGFPGDWQVELAQSTSPVPAPPALPVSIPSQVLRDRPDIRAAERKLAAATAKANVAVADLFPRFRIPLTLGTAASGYGSLFSAGSLIWSVTLAGSETLFDSGQREARIRAAKATTEGQRLDYQRKVQIAFRDVEDALTQTHQEGVREESLMRAQEDSQLTYDRALRERKVGTIDYLTLLTAERSLYLAEDQLIESKAKKALNMVSLAKALGGGWQTAYPETPSETAQSTKQSTIN
ncbi:MAG: efflux transporter outer membrane subunit [Pseudomonas sp.]|jgi:NodT family efflux transporter outer membrane factor (OMF) lipoprotein|uniref:efflux transporter outer membrane subunit n=1 Tax=Pseudomonadota TaxID=1224 RepID=UPI0007C86682|nr:MULTISPECIES: efflux transporter outer membrane subunit [Gammaproteobacteria]EKT9356011.1 efflux transporter outer membrane subunit [Enterobacter hormaechei]EKT9492408.1 efflux transporter outer membrane subunit [Pseudomonas aeruginosa]KSQ25298.2 hypothetical protein APB28_02130 [Pseudomonas aeruginosa]KSQ38103.2 hypothetical protein APB26_04495 [Pseudomonas aeruginosa]MBG6734710.1 efflux transporter outer membrane subunit [Pseudomonas aeruginosa]